MYSHTASGWLYCSYVLRYSASGFDRNHSASDKEDGYLRKKKDQFWVLRPDYEMIEPVFFDQNQSLMTQNQDSVSQIMVFFSFNLFWLANPSLWVVCSLHQQSLKSWIFYKERAGSGFNHLESNIRIIVVVS